jgi:hypothetical protein
MINLNNESNFIPHTNNQNPKLLSGFIDSDTNNKFISIFDTFCSKNISNDKVCQQFIFSNKEEVNYELKEILNEAYYYLSSNGFNIDKTNGLIEFWKYSCDGKKVTSNLDMHEDDYGGLPYCVETCIFYLQKDPNIIGGNLLYQEVINKWGFGLFSNIVQKKLEIQNNMVALLGGNLYHRPQSINGKGTRKCIVVQFMSISR